MTENNNTAAYNRKFCMMNLFYTGVHRDNFFIIFYGNFHNSIEVTA